MNAADPIVPARRPSIVVLFARFWSANMDMVHARGSSWPGFSYSDDEKAAMHRVAAAMPGFEFFMGMALAVVFALIVAGACVGLMFWRLNVVYGADPSKTPGSVFFFYLALAVATMLAGGMPVSIMLGAWLASKLAPPTAASIPDDAVARHLFVRSIRQMIRMGVLVSAAMLIYWLFVPADSKLELLLHAILPALAPCVSILTGLYYFSGRVQRGGGP